MTLGVCAPSFWGDFVFDDHYSAKAYIDQDEKPHEMIAELRSLPEYFGSHYLRGASTSSRGYRPVTVLSFALTYHLFCGSIEKDSALPHHALNVLLQVLNTFLVYLLLARLCSHRLSVVLGTLLFGVHAIHSGVVASIVGRGELFGFFFGASALLTWLAGLHPGAGPGRRTLAWIGTALLLFLAFCSKESALAFMVFIPIYRLALAWHDNDGTWPRRDCLGALAVSAVPLLVFLLLRSNALEGLPPHPPTYLSNPIYYVDPGLRLLTAIKIWGYALCKVLVPFSLCCDYGPNVFELVESALDPRFLSAAALLAAMLVGGLACARRQPLVFLALASFFGFSFIVSNVPFPQEAIYAERLYYTPSLGLAFLLVWVLERLRRWPRPGARLIFHSLLCLWLLASGAVHLQRMLIWKNNYSLFLHDAEVQPRCLRLLGAAAVECQNRKEFEKFGEYINRALAEEPELPSALTMMGGRLCNAGDLDGAEHFLQRSLNSPLLPKIDLPRDGSKLHYNLAVLMERRNQAEKAIEHFQKALAHAPYHSRSRYALLRDAKKKGDIPRIGKLIGEGEAYDPGNLAWKMHRGTLAYRLGRHAEAESLLRQSLPHLEWGIPYLEDWLDYIDSMVRLGKRVEARETLKRAIEMGGGVPPSHQKRVEEIRRRL